MSPGEVIATAALAGLLFGPVARLADLINIFEQTGASVDRLGEILDAAPEVRDSKMPLRIARAQGLVEFDHVWFGYGAGQTVLHDIQLRVEPGMKVALVGATGCGKSTLLSLCSRFYDPTAGEIRLDGVPIERFAIDDLRRQIAMVPQDPVIFAQSLTENIRYGEADADFDRVLAASRVALVHDFAVALPQSYETRVGEAGHRLSQGQRQRLAIARAFCKNAPVIMLDEATSSLDTASEIQIQIALANLLKGRTAFIIAHRLATVLDADLIVVMEEGCIVQTGRHEELVADPHGAYAQIAASQLCLPSRSIRWRSSDPEEPRPMLTAVPQAPAREPAPVCREARSA
jgi:ABC-type multidrug transport system fused ATPase/permease subunit